MDELVEVRCYEIPSSSKSDISVTKACIQNENVLWYVMFLYVNGQTNDN